MNGDLERKLLELELAHLTSILREAGLEVPPLDVEKLTDAELATLVRSFRRMARDPR